jgi:hypothetical protein
MVAATTTKAASASASPAPLPAPRKSGVGLSVRFEHLRLVSGSTVRLTDASGAVRPGRFTVTDPAGNKVDPSDLKSYSIVSANSIRQKAYETRRQAFGNIRRDFVVRGIPVALKAGVDLRTVLRDRRGTSGELYNYVGADGRASTTPTTQAGLINDDSPLPFLDAVYSTRIPDFGLPKQQHVDNGQLWQSYRANPNHWTRNANADYTNQTNNSNRVQEIISSGYFRADAAFFSNRLKLTTGLRAPGAPSARGTSAGRGAGASAPSRA